MFRFLAPHNYHQFKDMVITGVVKDNPPFLKRDQTGCIAFYGPSVRTTLDHIEEHMPAQQYKSSIKVAGSWDSDFYTFNTWEKCMDVFKNHPDQLIPKNLKDDRIEIRETSGKDVFYEITGDYVDVGRFMSGEPEHFGNMSMGNPMGIHADIMINMSIVAYHSAELLNLRQQRVVRLCDWLEAQSIRCKIAVFHINPCGHIEVQVKALGESIDLGALAVATSGDFLRRVFFRIEEHSNTLTSGYGTPCSVKDGGLNNIDFSEENGIVIVSELGNKDTKETINRYFDDIEVKLQTQLAEGERRMTHYI